MLLWYPAKFLGVVFAVVQRKVSVSKITQSAIQASLDGVRWARHCKKWVWQAVQGCWAALYHTDYSAIVGAKPSKASYKRMVFRAATSFLWVVNSVIVQALPAVAGPRVGALISAPIWLLISQRLVGVYCYSF